MISEVIVLPRSIEPAFGRPLLAPLRDDTGRVRLMAQRDLQHLFGRCHLKVQGQADLGH